MPRVHMNVAMGMMQWLIILQVALFFGSYALDIGELGGGAKAE